MGAIKKRNHQSTDLPEQNQTEWVLHKKEKEKKKKKEGITHRNHPSDHPTRNQTERLLLLLYIKKSPIYRST